MTASGGQYTAWDSVTGAALDIEKVMEARQVEIAYFHKMGAYTRVPRSQAVSEGAAIISLKWLDVNKGDVANPNMRSRLVGREFNVGRDDSLYAATPPLEALRVIISMAATQSRDGTYLKELMVNDVSRTYFMPNHSVVSTLSYLKKTVTPKKVKWDC